jgi:hypothetical protein
MLEFYCPNLKVLIDMLDKVNTTPSYLCIFNIIKINIKI